MGSTSSRSSDAILYRIARGWEGPSPHGANGSSNIFFFFACTTRSLNARGNGFGYMCGSLFWGIGVGEIEEIGFVLLLDGHGHDAGSSSSDRRIPESSWGRIKRYSTWLLEKKDLLFSSILGRGVYYQICQCSEKRCYCHAQ
jgi:hypothetical protein